MIFAYLDPGSGSLLLQAVLGGAAGLGVAAKAWGSRLKRRRHEPEADEDLAEEQPAESSEA